MSLTLKFIREFRDREERILKEKKIDIRFWNGGVLNDLWVFINIRELKDYIKEEFYF